MEQNKEHMMVAALENGSVIDHIPTYKLFTIVQLLDLEKFKEDTYQATFIYSKDGREEAFTLESLPDTTWSFVRTETADTVTRKSMSAVISIMDKDGGYADSLLASGKVIAVSIYKDKVSEKDASRLRRFEEDVRNAGFTPIFLSTTPIEGLSSYTCDYKTLITLNRSNGGATYINDGYIIRKWAKRALPDPEGLAMLSDEDPTDTFIGRDTGTSLAFQGFLLYVFAVMLLL